MSHRATPALGAFLRSRRARLTPQDAGLSKYGERRRVPGLRREELAQLAGVSVDYYVRFEQGRAANVSDTVVDAVAAALRLDRDEYTHLRDLVRATGPARPIPAPAPQGAEARQVRPGVRRLLDSMADTPACVTNWRTDILAWNPLYAALFTDFGALPPEQRNKLWMVFCHQEARSRFVDWEEKSRCLASCLRMGMGRHPGDPAYVELIAQLSAGSEDFRRIWADQDVSDKRHGHFALRHPAVGRFTLGYEYLHLPDDQDRFLITYTAEPGSPSEAALRSIARQAGHRPQAGAPIS
ncbi:helix-turn-helix transcriptional regulator [Streptomyces sp. MZ04]|uniref:helix-turn-helix transcriptional regulator n=1 Tax=Streptomyces sp. MZ04 TaxID=2559236 RepID=UPI00107ECFD2|nr:helix-turn-helix transcriptional regulator [Streptomyces sp. MZ04]TGB09106.1 XRE family transcriptional regulator [Streptomyces sp. MZ04]